MVTERRGRRSPKAIAASCLVLDLSEYEATRNPVFLWEAIAECLHSGLPLAGHLAGFARWASEQGYERYSRYRQVLLASCFSRWLGQHAITARRVSSEQLARYLRSRTRRARPHHGDVAALGQFLGFLRRQGVVPPERVGQRRLIPAEHMAEAFARYLRDERSLAPVTIVNYVSFIRGFLDDRFGLGPVTLSRVCASDVVGFVQRQAPRLHLKRAKVLTTALRSFLRYGRYRGDISLDLAAAVPTVANWSMSAIPRAIPATAVRQVLAAVDRRTTMALDLLQAGVDRSVIALWLGHESVETTQIYLEATLAMKEQALAKTVPRHAHTARYRPDDQLLGFLKAL